MLALSTGIRCLCVVMCNCVFVEIVMKMEIAKHELANRCGDGGHWREAGPRSRECQWQTCASPDPQKYPHQGRRR